MTTTNFLASPMEREQTSVAYSDARVATERESLGLSRETAETRPF